MNKIARWRKVEREREKNFWKELFFTRFMTFPAPPLPSDPLTNFSELF